MTAQRGQARLLLAALIALVAALAVAFAAAPAADASVHGEAAPARLTAGHHAAHLSPSARIVHDDSTPASTQHGLDAALPPADVVVAIATISARSSGVIVDATHADLPRHYDGRAPPVLC